MSGFEDLKEGNIAKIKTFVYKRTKELNMTTKTEIKAARGKFIAMATTYCLGVFNDNFFKQAAMLMAVSAGLSRLQGTATVLFSLPFILCSSYAGWFADRFAKRKVVIATKALELAAMLIGAVGMITANWYCILAMVFLMGLQSTLFSPALNGSIPELYPVDYVPQANAILKLATTLSILLGIATAGICLDQSFLWIRDLNPGATLVALVVIIVSGLGFAASFAVFSRPAATEKRAFPWFGPLTSLRDMLDICSERQMLTAFFSDNFFYFLATIVVLTINTLGLRQLGFSQTATSLLSVSLMIGVCVGSFLAARFVEVSRWSRFLVSAALGMAAGLFMAAASILVPPFIQLSWIVAALTCTGIFGGLFLIPVASFLQVRPADSDKGRVLATVNFSGFIGIMLAGMIFTTLNARFSPTQVMLCLACFSLAAAGVLYLLVKTRFNPIPKILQWTFRSLLSLRYRIEVKGLEAIKNDEGRALLFLPNHPALIDPVIVMSQLAARFHPRPLADADQVARIGTRWIMKHVRPITVPDIRTNGRGSRDRIKEALNDVVDSLLAGDNILFYPAGHLKRGAKEDLAGNSGVEYLLEKVPNVRTILVRTTGLWGSGFSWAAETEPSISKNFKRLLGFLAANLVFFGPRRRVTVEFIEEVGLAKTGGRQEINTFLENFYNARSESNTLVPYFWWQGRKPQVVPEPSRKKITGDSSGVSAATVKLVIEKIEQLSGQRANGSDRLANDLAMDSLILMELAVWLEGEFGVPVDDISALETVDDCILAASGQILHSVAPPAAAVPDNWFEEADTSLSLGKQATIADLFLDRAKRYPNAIVMADQLSGTKTYRQVLMAIMVLRPLLEKIPGDNIGIMLPASAGAGIVYLAALFAGKVPVMINWTVGIGNMRHGLDLTGVRCIITARALSKKLAGQGTDLAGLETDWLYMEDIAKQVSITRKISAAIQVRFGARSISGAPVAKTAAILFTSGSESLPKAVPLSHDNIIANLRDFSSIVSFSNRHKLLGMLPPFHSLGLVGTIILPLCLGLKTVYHANPTESGVLAGIIERYTVSIVIGTPTFLSGIIKAAAKEQLKSLRLVFTGAEKCPDHVYHSLKKINPAVTLCEGYGITECSPLVSINRVEQVRQGSIGKIMPSMEYAIVDPESSQRVQIGRQGLLLVRGPNIFGGYYRDGNGTGFSEFEGKRWYNTGDFVMEDGAGILRFCGRKKRFIKLGGEMISLPAIENILLGHFQGTGDNGPTLAIEATADVERPEIVLFTTLNITRKEANDTIKEAGLSPLHNVRMVRTLEAIPVLGTGKTDYKLLKRMMTA